MLWSSRLQGSLQQNSIKMDSQQHVRKRTTTVKPVLSDHRTVQGKVVVVDRWSLKQGFPETDRFFEALLNSYERCGTHAFDLHCDNSRQSGASGGLIMQ